MTYRLFGIENLDYFCTSNMNHLILDILIFNVFYICCRFYEVHSSDFYSFNSFVSSVFHYVITSTCSLCLLLVL